MDIYGVIKKFTNEKLNKKFIFAITINEENLLKEITAITKTTIPDDEYIKYEIERESILHEHAELDDDGKYIYKANSIKIKEQEKQIVSDKISELNKVHSAVIEKRNKDYKDFMAVLESKTIVDLQMVDFDDVPNEISKYDFLALKPMIAMSNEETK